MTRTYISGADTMMPPVSGRFNIGCELTEEDDKEVWCDYETLIRQQWPGYEVMGFLGRGGNAYVYEIARMDSTGDARYAVKVIPVSEKAEDPKLLRQEGRPNEEITQYPGRRMKEVSREVQVMRILKGHPHIVSIEDFSVIRVRELTDSCMLIRMELLKPFRLWHEQHSELIQEDIARIGVELCRAVEHCHNSKIIHRDIKLDNIFVNAENHFKLGDFGYAWMVESDQPEYFPMGVAMKNVPEGYTKYLDPRNFESLMKAEIYSVGMVLYKLLNADTDPFLPTDRLATPMERESAKEVRMRGILPVPPPMHADDVMTKIVLKACAYNPEQRYNSVRALREELEALSDAFNHNFY